MKECLS